MTADALSRMMTCALIFCAFVWPAAGRQRGASPPPPSESNIRQAVVRELGDPLVGAADFNFVSREADLNGDGRPELLVWAPAPAYGGTGGYPLLIFRREGRRLRLLSQFENVWTPLFVLDSSRRGWRDLAVQVGGGGEPMRYVVYRHNGRSYSNRFREIRESRIRGRQLIGAEDWRMTPLGPIPVKP